MIIEYYHASKHGNGVMVAEEFKRIMNVKGVTVNIHHVKKSKPKEIAPADLYLFSSPGRFGKPSGDIRDFLKKVQLASGTRCAVLTTEIAPQPDKKTGKVLTEEGDCQKVLPIMREIMQTMGLTKVAEGRVYVEGIKGPLENGWQNKVRAFAELIPVIS
jgi:multimeric flavodoxin WrbA